MDENLVLIISSLAAFSYTLISTLSFRKAKKDIVFLWLGLLFFSPFISFASNLLLYLKQGSSVMFHLSMIFNLSWGGYLVLFINSLGHKQKKTFNIWLFIPTMLYIPFLVYSIFDPQYVNEFVAVTMKGTSLIIYSVYNAILVGYSIVANIVLMILEIRKMKLSAVHKLRAELLIVSLILQLLAFLPYILRLDTIYLIMYMPVYGLIFFLYIFFRLSSSKANFLHPIMKEKYTGISISEEKRDEIKDRILNLMDQKRPFLDENCSLQRIANDLGESPNTISMVINADFNKSFSDFINSYRIQWSIELLQSGNLNFTIEGIAFECGFGNRTSFYQAFKKETGKLPKDYLNKGKAGKSLDEGRTVNAGTLVK
ncbi:MAG: helix-turn-helix domain-containing protein [Bacteroidales bacterium]|nr:helix-turn-helix domain-containing protein [Bacteroidales bacterium]